MSVSAPYIPSVYEKHPALVPLTLKFQSQHVPGRPGPWEELQRRRYPSPSRVAAWRHLTGNMNY